MRLRPFFVKYATFFLLLFVSTVLSATTLVNEKVIGVKGVKPAFEIMEQKASKLTVLKLDFQKIVTSRKEQLTTPVNIEKPLDKLAPRVVIDDVVVFLDGNNSLEGMMVYHGTTNTIQPSNCLSAYSPG